MLSKCVIYDSFFIFVDVKVLRCLQNKRPTFTVGSVGPYKIQVESLSTLMKDNKVSDEVNYHPYIKLCQFLHLFPVHLPYHQKKKTWPFLAFSLQICKFCMFFSTMIFLCLPKYRAVKFFYLTFFLEIFRSWIPYVMSLAR